MEEGAGEGVSRVGAVHAVQQRVEPAQPDRVHLLRLGGRVVFVEFGKENLDGEKGTARLLSFYSSWSPSEKALSNAKATVS